MWELFLPIFSAKKSEQKAGPETTLLLLQADITDAMSYLNKLCLKYNLFLMHILDITVIAVQQKYTQMSNTILFTGMQHLTHMSSVQMDISIQCNVQTGLLFAKDSACAAGNMLFQIISRTPEPGAGSAGAMPTLFTANTYLPLGRQKTWTNYT